MNIMIDKCNNMECRWNSDQRCCLPLTGMGQTGMTQTVRTFDYDHETGLIECKDFEPDNSQLERGAAGLVIKFTDGQLTVMNESTTDVLLAGPLPLGGWNKIIKAIIAAAPDANGIMED